MYTITVDLVEIRVSRRTKMAYEKLINKRDIDHRVIEILSQLTEALIEMELHDEAWSKLYTFYHRRWRLADKMLYKMCKIQRPKSYFTT